MIDTKDKYWKTSDPYLAAFLFGRGAVIVGVEVVERKTIFAFIDSLERQEWKEEFESGTPMIDARIYVYAIQALRQKRMDALIEQSHGESRP